MMRWLVPVLLAIMSVLPLAHAQASPAPVDTQVYVINIGNYDATKGTYVADF